MTDRVVIALQTGGYGSTVEVNGQRLCNVSAVTVHAEAGRATTVELHLAAPEVAIVGVVDQVKSITDVERIPHDAGAPLPPG